MYKDIAQLCGSCDACMRHTVVKHGFHPQRSIMSKLPGDHYIMDIMEMPLSTDGLSDLLVVIDVFTGFIMLKPLLNKEAATIARALWEVFCIIGPPKILQHDREAAFMSEIMTALWKHEGINQRIITAYHPQADGKVERSIQTIRDMINKEIKSAHEHWPLFVPFVQLCYNHRITEISGSSPFSLMFGRRMNELVDYTNAELPQVVDMNNWKKHQEEVISLIFPAIHLRSRRIQNNYIQKLHKYKRYLLEHDLAPGTCVMIKDPEFIKSPGTRPKENARYLGPYYVIRRTLHGNYVLRDATGDVYDRNVPLDQIKVTKAKKWDIEYHNKDDIYQIDYIVDDRIKKGKKEFLIKWAGYPHSDNTWESITTITDKKIIQRYERRKQAKASVYQDLSSYIYLISSTISSPYDD
jgi:transposase InsO family protein